MALLSKAVRLLMKPRIEAGVWYLAATLCLIVPASNLVVINMTLGLRHSAALGLRALHRWQTFEHIPVLLVVWLLMLR
jgi:hypothetical protein